MTKATKNGGNPSQILHKIATLEKQVQELKLSALKQFTPSKKNLVSLKGILKGVNVSEEDIAKAKKSLYSRMPL